MKPEVERTAATLPVHVCAANPATRPARWLLMRLVFASLVVLFPASATAELLANVDKTTVSNLETLTLTVSYSGADPGEEPDFSILEKDFVVQGTSAQTSSTFRMGGGRTTRALNINWIVQLVPRKLGTLVIPSFQIAGERSQPIAINASRNATGGRRESQTLFFETMLDKSTVYVQEQLIYTVRLYWAEAISGEFPPPPAIDNAVVETLTTENRFSTVRDNRRYNVLEKQYAIFPQQSGDLIIPPESFNGLRGGDSLFNFSRRETVFAQSEPSTIRVKPHPPQFPDGAPWLPASALNIQELWSSSPPVFVVGQPLSRTLTLTADGVAASLLPPLSATEMVGTRMYPDPPATDEAILPAGIRATRVETTGIVPTNPGLLTIPELRIPWWNTTTDTLEYAVIAARRTVIEAAPVTHLTPVAPPTEVTPEAATVPGTNSLGGPDYTNYWFWAAMGFGVLWCLTLVQWFTDRRKWKGLAPSAPRAAEAGRNADQLWVAVVSACRNNDASGARTSLLKWLAARFHTTSIQTLLHDHPSPELRSALAELDGYLYAPTGHQTWNGAALLASLAPIATKPEDHRSTLAALHPAQTHAG